MNNSDIIVNLAQANQKIGEIKDEINERIHEGHQTNDERTELVKDLKKVQNDLIQIMKKFIK